MDKITLSIDVGIRNFGILAVDGFGSFLKLENLDLNPYSVKSLSSALDKFIEPEYKINQIIIERQIVTSYKIMEVAQHSEMYFHLKYPEAKFVVYDPKKKNLDGVKGYDNRKKMSIEKALEFLEENKNLEMIDKISKMKKKDDVCDAICQWISWNEKCLKGNIEPKKSKEKIKVVKKPLKKKGIFNFDEDETKN